MRISVMKIVTFVEHGGRHVLVTTPIVIIGGHLG